MLVILAGLEAIESYGVEMLRIKILGMLKTKEDRGAFQVRSTLVSYHVDCCQNDWDDSGGNVRKEVQTAKDFGTERDNREWRIQIREKSRGRPTFQPNVY